jgi:hypothetical protein
MKFRISMLYGVAVGTLAGSIITATLILNSASAADNKQPAAPPAILTIYIVEHGSSVKEMNEAHNKYYAQGYRWAGMTAHNENGDHKGVWVTYVLKE